jgi:hypothetical protein
MESSTRSNAVPEGVIYRIFWRSAWHPLATIGGIWLFGFALGNAFMIPGSFVLGRDGLGTAALFSVGGALIGLLTWGASVGYVNHSTEGIESRFEQTCREAFDLDDSEPTHVTGIESRTGLAPADAYRFTSIRPDGETMELFRAEFDMEACSMSTYPPVYIPCDRFDDIENEIETLSLKIDNMLWTVPRSRTA